MCVLVCLLVYLFVCVFDHCLLGLEISHVYNGSNEDLFHREPRLASDPQRQSFLSSSAVREMAESAPKWAREEERQIREYSDSSEFCFSFWFFHVAEAFGWSSNGMYQLSSVPFLPVLTSLLV